MGASVTTGIQPTDHALQWLLEGDPAIRWQALRDLGNADERDTLRARRRVAHDGWGARLLARQQPSGNWGGGLYCPKFTSTTYTMLLLRDFGLAPSNRQARQACRLLLDAGLRPDGGINYATGAKSPAQSETCITGMVLSILSYFEHDDPGLDTIFAHLLERQMSDGGWNCRRALGATHSSVHTTISVLEGLRLYELLGRRHAPAAREAQRLGREFLLIHRLFRSDRTGQVINPVFTRFAFPPRWHYDVLRALDYFQSVDAPCDPRLADGIDIVNQTRLADGRWTLQHSHHGKTHFRVETKGAPSRWNTLRALRVLSWWAKKSNADADSDARGLL